MLRRRPVPSRARGYAPPGTALTASSQRSTRETSQDFRRLFQPWQATALATYSSVPECWYASQFYARSLSKLRIFVGRKDAAGEVEELEPTDPAAKLLDRVKDPGGGRATLLGSYGRLMFLIGEAYLTVTGEGSSDEKWEFLSPLELRPIPGGNGFIRTKAPGLTMETLTAAPEDSEVPAGDEAVVWRVWRRHPAYSMWADSPMNATLLLFEELSLLQLAVRARAKARANRGILYVSTDLSFGDPEADGDENAATDTFMEDLSNTLLAPVRDPGAPSSVIPFVIRGPSSVPDASGNGVVTAEKLVFHIPLIDPEETNDEETAKTSIIKRIAIGLDLPPEILTGMAEVNHWGAWQIDEASWTAHVQPMADQLVGDLGSSYLRPAAEQEGIEGWDDLVVGYDASEIINHPDRTNDVREGFRDLVVSPATYLETIGLTEEDAMSPEEASMYSVLLGKSGGTPLLGEPVDQETVIEDAPVEPTQADIVRVQDEESIEASAVAEGFRLARVERIVGAAEAAVERTRVLAGSRLVQKARNCDDCKDLIDGVPNGLVASALGAERVAELAPGTILTDGGAGEFRATLGRWGVEDAVAAKLGQLVETHAASGLYGEAEPLPAGFAAYVRKVA